jgi:hypothetical protein
LTYLVKNSILVEIGWSFAMESEKSRKKLLQFLDYLAAKGLMAQATVVARKAAVSKVLGILSEDEAEDVTKLNLDDVMVRFTNLEGKSYTPGSLTTYLSRVKSAVDDFSNYLENPLGFKPSVQSREKRKPEGKNQSTTLKDSNSIPSSPREQPKAPLSSSILPIPIRPDITVFVQGLPYDLTESEANKIANVIRAMATPP